MYTCIALALNFKTALELSYFLFSILASVEVQRAAQEMLSKETADSAIPQHCYLEKSPEHNIQIEFERDDMSRQCEDLRSELASLQSATESAHSDNARLQVHVATLQSRITALSAQHTALQE